MDKFVAHLYIQDYREKIAAEADEAQRQKLLRLLAEEEAKLAVIEAREKKEKELSTPTNVSVSRQSASWFRRQSTP